MGNGIKKTALAFGIFFLTIGLGINKTQANPNRGISLQVFYDELSYHGDWINNPDYGYVWRPNVGRDFRPYYTNGRWVMTEYGNTWVSDYEWGWAPFHYGRWFYDDYDGWIWTPDTEWGPAWVTWRTGGGYYGWAPLAPRISVNINIGRRYFVPNNHWVFIPQRCIYYPSYGRYWEPRRNVYIINNTTIINNVYTNRNVNYYSGPGRDDVRRATRQNVPVYRVADGTRPGSDRISRDAVNIYRPNVSRGDNASAPRSIASNSPRPTRADNATNNNRTDVNRVTSSNSRTENGSAVNSDLRPSRSDSNYGTTNSARPDVNRGTTSSTRTENGGSVGTDARPSRSENPSGNREASPNTRVERTQPSQPAVSPESSSSRSESSRPSNSGSSRTERSTPNQSTPAPSPRTQSSNSSRSERSATSSNTPTRSVERSQPSSKSSSSSSRGGGSSSSSSGRPTRGGN
ncbi:DUF6600 domain-containing protein [Pedobacter alpinus]|uniref:DUF6600 domain-containing protein n=1 Tax=Pedobacter alpinus TaxID=1590643 RepID=A0ABW5TVX7_9SPHI